MAVRIRSIAEVEHTHRRLSVDTAVAQYQAHGWSEEATYQTSDGLEVHLAHPDRPHERKIIIELPEPSGTGPHGNKEN